MTDTAPIFADTLPTPGQDFATVIKHHFPSLASAPVPPDKPRNAWHSDAWQIDRSKWAGTPNMNAAIKLATDGWPAGADKARALRDKIEASRPTIQRLTRFDVAGATPDVRRFLAGNPLNMRRLAVSTSSRTPVLSIVCDVANSANISADDILAQAAAVAAVADMLEEARYRVEILSVWRSRNNYDAKRATLLAEIAIRLKAPEDSSNLQTLAYGIGHAAMLRRHGFAIVSNDPRCAPLSDCLGYPHHIKHDPHRSAYVAPAAQLCSGTPPERFRKVCAELRKQGCPGIPTADDLGTAT